MKKKKRGYTLYILAALLVLIMAGFFLRGNKGEKAIKVVTEKALRRDIIETVSASGKVFPEVEVEITSNVSGTLIELLVKEGELVKSGQLLARIDADALTSVVERTQAASSTARAQLESIKSQREQLLAQFKNTENSYKRNKTLFEQGVISKAEYEISLASYESSLANLQTAEQNILAAQFSVKSADATVKEQKKSLSQTSIYAPIDGIVSKLYKKRGEQVVGTIQMAGTPILKISNLSSVEVRIDVNERDILNVQLNDSAVIELDAYPNRKFAGLVSQIANNASNALTAALTSDAVTNFEVKIRLLPESYKDIKTENGKSPFRAGLSASAEIKTNIISNVLTVPIGAVTAKADEDSTKQDKNAVLQEYVFVQSGDSVLMRAVSVSAQDDAYIQITKGLNENEMVIKAPYDAVSKQLKTGSKIDIVTEKDLYKKTEIIK
jgi:HlyD family secretion protein